MRTRLAVLVVLLSVSVSAFAIAGGAPPSAELASGFRVGFGVRAITPTGTPPAEWSQYFTPQPRTGIWGEPFEDLDGDGCMSGLTNYNLEPILDGKPPRGQRPEPHVDQPWNSTGDAYKAGAFTVRGVTIVGDPDSTGKWDGLWANAGFGARCATGVHDDTYARAIVLEHGGSSVAMVSLDVVGLFNIEIERAREEMRVRYPSMNVGELIVSSTHTHEGVDTMGYWGQLYLNTDGKFPAYQAFIRSQIIDAVHEAWTSREAAKVKLAVGAQPAPIRDSRPPRVIDGVVPAAQFVAADDGATLGTIVNWSNHPEAQGSGNGLISSDFPWGAREVLEAELGGTAIYFSGAVGGLQTPLGVDIPGFGSGVSWERTYEIGRLVARSAIDALANAAAQKIDSLTVKRRVFYLDSDNTAIRALNVRGIFDIPSYAGGESWGADPAGHRDGVRMGTAGPQIRTEMVSVEAGPMHFLTVPGELSPEIEIGGYGRPDCPSAHTGRPYEPVIRDQFSHPYQFVLGLAQDELGYIIPGYDFHYFAAGDDADHDGHHEVPIGALEASTCGEGHYEETVSGSSVLAPWVACVAAELAGRDPWASEPACSYANTHVSPYGIGE